MEKFSRAEIMKMVAVSAVAVAIFALVVEADLCGVSTQGLAKCMPAVKGSNPPKPTLDCCNELKKANFTCLCGLKETPEIKILGIDVKLAQQLPKKCNLSSVHC
ncbi:hypothetical protein MLD38_010827 [Melastoma candidum]|uniref:Uncharacterized protein n=2 Tax=Melastoma candidum TaxID=119954 RepID=A0ACB9R2E1_9MYRT|nr:hypothetical protein MLD38_010825 [Melastoma candidum]KAI4372619.1 hypothetical protein MLD38_010827 [Melastoma candidum]